MSEQSNQLKPDLISGDWKEERAKLYDYVREAEKLLEAVPDDTDDLHVMMRGIWAKVRLLEGRLRESGHLP